MKVVQVSISHEQGALPSAGRVPAQSQAWRSILPVLFYRQSEARGLRQQAASFEEKDGVLFYRSESGDARSSRQRRVVAAQSEQERLIRACHYPRTKYPRIYYPRNILALSLHAGFRIRYLRI